MRSTLPGVTPARGGYMRFAKRAGALASRKGPQKAVYVCINSFKARTLVAVLCQMLRHLPRQTGDSRSASIARFTRIRHVSL